VGRGAIRFEEKRLTRMKELNLQLLENRRLALGTAAENVVCVVLDKGAEAQYILLFF